MNIRNLIFPYHPIIGSFSILYLYTISCIILKSNLIYANGSRLNYYFCIYESKDRTNERPTGSIYGH